jgi:hypothetical protein
MGDRREATVMVKRFAIAFVTFVALIVPGTLMAALLASPAYPAPLLQSGCARGLAATDAAAMHTQVQRRHPDADACSANRLYFLELVKVRAATASCIQGPARVRELGRLDADVARANDAIAATCN